MFILQFLWLILPGAIANSTPVFIKSHFKFLAKPVDGGKKFKGKPILGQHKTWRGMIIGSLAGTLTGVAQGYLYNRYQVFSDISVVDFSKIPGWFLGFMMGFGSLFGDLIKSFFKRRANIKPGAPFFPWDQLDSFIGAVVFVSLVYRLPFEMIAAGIIGVPLVHLSTNLLAYYLGLKKTKF